MSRSLEDAFLKAIHSREPIDGLSHIFYRYPARFSPQFARTAIELFSKPGDLILDPFMGGGTSIVEASILGRQAIGVDISNLAFFISKAKTTQFSKTDLEVVQKWILETIGYLSLKRKVSEDNLPISNLITNLDGNNTWPIRKTIQLILDRLPILSKKQQLLARCILLKSSQWALDCRMDIPNSIEFKKRIIQDAETIVSGAKAYNEALLQSKKKYNLNHLFRVKCLNRSVVGIESNKVIINYDSPQLILTSPPYPGVHIVYHRWQIQGRRESPAPFWISNTLDGSGGSFYTFGDRKQKELTSYYQQALAAFSSLSKISNRKTIVVQMIAFSDPIWQLDQYLEMMERAGFREIIKSNLSKSPDGRIRRIIPNRKWYANQERSSATSQEVVLFHKKR